MAVPKERFKYIYSGYDAVLSRGVEQRSLNTVVVHLPSSVLDPGILKLNKA